MSTEQSALQQIQNLKTTMRDLIEFNHSLKRRVDDLSDQLCEKLDKRDVAKAVADATKEISYYRTGSSYGRHS